MTDWNWTDDQRNAIDALGSSVLVSAGAGSGKTAVLAERCAHLMADLRPPCPVDRLLVVTFTDAAATEMRERIADALRARLESAPTNRWLQRQLALLDTASISTIHAFCRRVLNRYFAQADLDPLAPLLDAQDAELLRRETAKKVFDRFADREDPKGEAFLDLLAAYSGPSESGLIQRVLQVDAFLTSVPDPQAWTEACSRRFASGDAARPPATAEGPKGLRDQGTKGSRGRCDSDAKPAALSSFWSDRLTAWLLDELASQHDAVQAQLALLQKAPPIAAESAACLEDYAESLGGWLLQLRQASDIGEVDRICRNEIGPYAFPAVPRRTRKIDELPEHEQQAFSAAADSVRRIRQTYFQGRLKIVFGRFTSADWAEGIARTGGHVEMLLSLVREVRKTYQNAKRELGVVDFADLERMTLDLLRDEKAGVANRLRDKYEHVLVDEFQDVNRVQAEILQLVARETPVASGPHVGRENVASDARVGRISDSRAGNLFVVGDVKQSIYRFRLAEPKLFLDRREVFQGESGAARISGRVIDLLENHRSRPRVIDAVNAVFKRIMVPDLGGIAYDDHAELKPGRKEPAELAAAAGPAMEVHVLDKVSGLANTDEDDSSSPDAFDWEQIEREAYVVAQRIRSLAAEGTPYSDIAILLRALRTHADLFVRTISRSGVPVCADVAGGFFIALEVQDVLSLLALLDNRQQDIPLATVLRSPLFGEPLTDSQLVEIKCAARNVQKGMPFHAAVRRYAQHGPGDALQTYLTTILGRLEQWRGRIRRRPIADVLWEIYEESGCFAYVAGLREGPQRQANLLRLHEYARRFDTFRQQGLHRFLRFIDGLRDSDQDLEPGTVAAPSGNVVRVMTIHRSKGLEFPIVILADLGKRFNLSDTRGRILFDRELGIALEAVDAPRRIVYPTLPHSLVSRAAVSESLAEEMRVLYVALTRARERLLLVGTKPLRQVREMQQKYEGHSGPLSLLDRRSASSMLDWVLGAICCQPAGDFTFDAPGNDTAHDILFAVHTYEASGMERWVFEPKQETGIVKRLKACAAMKPLAGSAKKTTSFGAPSLPGAGDGAVEIVARRLTTPYPATALTHVPAVMAASVLKRRWDSRQDEAQPAADWRRSGVEAAAPSHLHRRFRPPEFLEDSPAADPAARGTWTHECLQRLDLRRPCDADDVREQLRGMVQAGILAREEAAAIRVDDIAWFFQTQVGREVREPATRILREWPFVLAVDPVRYDSAASAADAGDFMLVRGIIDCLFAAAGGEWEVLDYKTDDVSAEKLAARSDEYRGQLDIYAAAVEAVWQRPVARRWLAFLSARQIVEV